MVVLPPVEADLLGFVDRTDQKADANRQELDFRERHLDVTGDDEALVEDAIKDFDQAGGSRVLSTADDIGADSTSPSTCACPGLARLTVSLDYRFM